MHTDLTIPQLIPISKQVIRDKYVQFLLIKNKINIVKEFQYTHFQIMADFFL
jgi:hypothetical protein